MTRKDLLDWAAYLGYPAIDVPSHPDQCGTTGADAVAGERGWNLFCGCAPDYRLLLAWKQLKRIRETQKEMSISFEAETEGEPLCPKPEPNPYPQRKETRIP